MFIKPKNIRVNKIGIAKVLIMWWCCDKKKKTFAALKARGSITAESRKQCSVSCVPVEPVSKS